MKMSGIPGLHQPFSPHSKPDFLKNPGSLQLWACNGPAIP
jgi:hypothetical protein